MDIHVYMHVRLYIQVYSFAEAESVNTLLKNISLKTIYSQPSDVTIDVISHDRNITKEALDTNKRGCPLNDEERIPSIADTINR